MAKKKAPKPTTKTSAKTKKNAEPKSGVRVRSKIEREVTPAKAFNRRSAAAVEGAASGRTAAQKAAEIEYRNQMRKNSAVPRTKVVKIRSGGMGGMFGTKNR